MVDERSRDSDAAQARWESHYSRREGEYTKGAVGAGAQEVDILEAVSSLEPGTALDVGCGAGGLCVELARRGWVVTGIDIAERAIDIARRIAAEQGVNATFLRADAAVGNPIEAMTWSSATSGFPLNLRFAVQSTQACAVPSRRVAWCC